jgi:hypothetical protein
MPLDRMHRRAVGTTRSVTPRLEFGAPAGHTLPGVYALLTVQVLNGLSSAVFGVMMPVAAADPKQGTGGFNFGAPGAGDGDRDRCVLVHLARRSLWREDRVRFRRAAGVVLLWIGLPDARPLLGMPREQSGADRYSGF